MSDGWHPDPYGRYGQRYHDGTSWTNHVSNVGGVTEEDPMGTAPNPPGAIPTAPPVAPSEWQQPQAASGFGAVPGNPWLRFLARLIDGIIIGLPLFFILDPIFDIGTFESVNTESETSFDASVDYPIGALAIQFAVFAVYDILMLGKFGRTVGKMVCGLTVVRKSDRSLPGYGAAAVRYVVGILYAIPVIGWILFIVTVIMGFSSPLRQTIHDKAASTVVAKTSSL